MIGAILAMRKADIYPPAIASRRLAFFDRFDDLLDLGLDRVHFRCVRIRNEAAHHGDALDQLGYSLHQQHGESDHDQRLRRPLREAAGITRLFVDLEGAIEERHAGYQHDDAERQQKENVADDVDAVAQLFRQVIVDDVDADMLVIEQRPGRAHQEDDAKQQPLQFEPGIRRGIEDLANDGVHGGNDYRHQDQPGQPLANPSAARVNVAAQLQQRSQRLTLPDTPLPSWPRPFGAQRLVQPRA